ncbi:hypothetical protein Tco_0509458 [Tanacetum coccineum]
MDGVAFLIDLGRCGEWHQWAPRVIRSWVSYGGAAFYGYGKCIGTNVLHGKGGCPILNRWRSNSESNPLERKDAEGPSLDESWKMGAFGFDSL